MKIEDQEEYSVSGANVIGDWYLNGTLLSSGSGITGQDGFANIQSGRIKGVSSGMLIEFCVIDVAHNYIYVESANVETCDRVTVP